MAALPSPPVAPSRRRVLSTLVVVGATGALGSCSGRYPDDTASTLDRVEGGTLRVGVSPHPPFTAANDMGRVSGSEVDLVERFAEHLGAAPAWTVGAETDLVPRLHEGELDVLIGGLDAKSPWSKEIALTRAYGEAEGPDGSRRKLVMAVRAGENALLTELERFLAEVGGEL